MSVPSTLDLRGYVPGASELGPVVEHLRGGGLLAYPTETVYGLGGLARPGPVEALRRLKGREERPFLVLLPSIEVAEGLRWTAAARELADVFWPGALTLVLPDPERRFPPGVRSREGTVAVRLSPHPLVRALLAETGEALTSTSANAPGGEPARTAEEALRAAAAMGAGEELWILDGGRLEASPPSTVVDCTGPVPVVLRAGAVPVGRLGCVLREVEVADGG